MAARANTSALSKSPFTLLPAGESRLSSFGVGFALECLAVVVLISLPLLLPQEFKVTQRYWATPVEAPPIVAWKPQLKLKPIHKVEMPKPVVVQPPPAIKLVVPVFTSPIAKPKPARPNPNPVVPEVDKAFPTAAPALGSSAIPTLQRPKDPVQTGGFGDTDGLKANDDTHRAPNIAQLGAYDMPNGSGFGNGASGAKGTRGVIASSGFGNGVAASAGGQSSHGGVQQGLFSNEQAVAQAPKAHQSAAPVAQPVEITYKPRPAYTDEARNLKIEGEVLLQVVFSASGQVQVQRVVRGLGHGLDESAAAAARAIQFKPARTVDGQPVDSTAIVHIVFELAY